MGIGSHTPGAYGLANLAKPNTAAVVAPSPLNKISSLPSTAGLDKQYGSSNLAPAQQHHNALARVPSFTSVSSSDAGGQYLALPATAASRFN